MPTLKRTVSLAIFLISTRAFSETTCSGKDCAVNAAAQLGLVAVGAVLPTPKPAPEQPKIEIDCKLTNPNGADSDPCDSIKIEIASVDKSFSKSVILQGRLLSTPVSNATSTFTIVASRLKCPAVKRRLSLLSNKRGALEFSRSDCN